jgi:hypothetical protein
MGAPAPDMGMGMGAEPEMGMGDELDLDAIIRELELDIANDPTAQAPQADPTAQAPVPESFDQVNAGTKVNGAFDGSLKEGDDPNSNGKDGKSPTAVDGVNGGKKVQPGTAVTATSAEDTKTVSESKEWDLDEILREFEEADSTDSASLQEKCDELEESLKEHVNVIHFLRGKLHEVNLLNSKLLFTNQLFKGFDLNGSQKVRVVETFDRATTVREAKLIYTTLAESFMGKTGKASAKTAKTITEGLASKPIGSTKPKSQPIIAENQQDAFVTRMKQLAGIIK